MSIRRALSSLVAASSFACGAPAFVDQPTQALMDPDGEGFWRQPLPSDLRREADGSFDLEDWRAAKDSDLLVDWLGTADRRLREGWGVSSGVFAPLSGPIDGATLPATPEASMSAESTVFLVDIDAGSPERGRRLPLDVRVLDEIDAYTPENLLAAVPVFGFLRRPATTYALVITTGVRDAAGAPLGRSLPFHEAFEDAGADEDRALHYAPLRDWLEEEGIARETVAGAAVFRTIDHNRDVRELVDWRARTVPAALNAPWTIAETYESYQVLVSSFLVPVIQRGERPYTGSGEGVIKRDANGEPEIVDMQEVRLILAVPKAPQPRDGFPLLMYLHGSGGEAYEFVDRGPQDEQLPRGEQPDAEPGTGPAEWLARRGVASLGFDFGLHGERHNPPDTTGLVFYNLFGNVAATLDNFTIAVMELTMISEIAETMTIDPSVAPMLDAGDAPDGLIRFDPERLTAMGQSMGTTLGVPWAGVDPRLDGIVFSGAGGVLVEIAVTAVEPVELKGVVELALRLEEGQEVHLMHPALHAVQNLWDFVDPIAKAPHVFLDPAPGSKPKHVMMTAGVRDGYFHPRSQAALAVAMGLPLAGEEVEPILPSALRLAGRDPTTLPVRANLQGGLTAAVLQYDAPNVNGHYVVFNQGGARHQYTCFAATVGTEAPVIPVGGGDAAPCE